MTCRKNTSSNNSVFNPKDTPTVSVIIPVFNGLPFLSEAIESSLNQTCTPLEVLVIDDGSTDDSAAVAQAFGPPVRVIRQVNQGESVARNRGIEESKGEWVAFLDADDVWLPTKLERQLSTATSTTNSVHTLCAFIDEDGRRVDTPANVAKLSSVAPKERYSFGWILRNATGGVVWVPSLLVRRDVSPRFPEWSRYGEDFCYTFELIARGSIELVDAELCLVRQRQGSQSSGDPLITVKRHETLERWMSENPDVLSEDEKRRARSNCIRKIVREMRRAKRRRDWTNWSLFREHLARFPFDEHARNACRAWLAPPWVFKCVDSCRYLTRKL